jgi:hypothetical protein
LLDFVCVIVDAAVNDLIATAFFDLNRWARNTAVTAEHATISRLWLEQDATCLALIEIQAGVGRHFLFATRAALRASDHAFEKYFVHVH